MNVPQSKKERTVLIAILVASIVMSIAYSFYFRIPPAVDARAYDTIAEHLVQGVGYRESLEGPLENDNAIARVGPGYEFFLAGVYSIFGHHYEIVWLLQALVLAGSAWLTWLLTKEIFGDQWRLATGVTATVLVGFSPDFITTQAMLLTETLGVCLMLLAVWMFFRFLRDNRRHTVLLWLIGFAISWAVAVLVRTPTLFIIIPVGIFFLLGKRIKELFIVCAVSGLIFFPWTLRNWHVYHAFLPTNAAGPFNLIIGNHLGASGEQDPYPLLDEKVKELGYLGAGHWATQEARAFITQHPLEFFKVTIKRISIYFSAARPTGFWFHLHGAAKAITLATSALYAGILFLLGFIGLLSARRLSSPYKNKAWLLAAMLFMMPLATVFLVVETRYRFPVYPFFAVFAGYAASLFIRREIKFREALAVGIVFFGNTAADIFLNLSRIFERFTHL